MLRNIINTLFGTGRKTEVHQKPIISEADSVKDSISETPIPQLSVDLGDPEVKIKLLGSIFPEKIYYDGKKYRTSRFNHLLSVIFHETKHLQGQKKVESPEKSENSTWVAASELLSNHFLKDLDRIWALKYYFPDPSDPSSWR